MGESKTENYESPFDSCGINSFRGWSGWPNAKCKTCGRKDPWEIAIRARHYDPFENRWSKGKRRLYDFKCKNFGNTKNRSY